MLITTDCLTTTMLYEFHPLFGDNVEIAISNPCEPLEQAWFMHYHGVGTTLEWNKDGLQFQMSTKL